MNVTLWYFDECPNWKIADQRLRDLAASDQFDFQIEHRAVRSIEEAESVGFAGSPTIEIDGHDAFAGESPEVGFACRIYVTDAGREGAPSISQLQSALGAASGLG